jgi:uncharacterized protein YneF (UPF0154 family)
VVEVMGTFLVISVAVFIGIIVGDFISRVRGHK